MTFIIVILFFFTSIFATDALDIRILRVEFKKEEPDNSLTTGNGTFNSDPKEYKLDPKGARNGIAYWKNHLEFAKNYFEQASNGKVNISYEVYPKNKDAYKLDKQIIDYNRTSRKKGEKLAEFDSARAVDYADFVNDVLKKVKKENPEALAPSLNPKRVILIAHAGSSRLVDGGTMGTRGANTPGDFMDIYIDTTTWSDFWKGFPVSEKDTITSVMVTSETASQDGLNWGINGFITSQIGRELGLPYSYDVIKGYSRLGYFDGMDFAGSNAGNGFFPSLPNAWMRAYKEWSNVAKIKKDTVIHICAAGASPILCGLDPQIVEIPINSNEYILLENRQRTYRTDGKITVGMDDGRRIEIPVDSLRSHFLDSATQKYSGVIKYIEEGDAAIPASGIAAWHVNDWYINELISYGAINAWGGDTFRDHQYGIALIEADGILGLGKDSYFGSGSDLIPHSTRDTVFSINPTGYANTASTFGGYSGIKITAQIPKDAKAEKTFNAFTGDSVVNWRALKIPVKIEWVGKYVKSIPKIEWPYTPTDEHFAASKAPDFTRVPLGADSMYLGNNRLYIIDSNNVPLQNFPVMLSNGEPFVNFNSKPLAIDLTGKDSLYVLIPANNGLILAANSKGKLLKEEFPLAAGTFEYENPDTLLLHISADYKYLFTKHRDNINAFYLPEAKKYTPKTTNSNRRDEISEFFIFPNPIKNGKATARFRILNDANSASIDIFDITGKKVFNRNISDIKLTNEEPLDLSKLGSDIYSARLTVKFASGTKKEKWVRIGVRR